MVLWLSSIRSRPKSRFESLDSPQLVRSRHRESPACSGAATVPHRRRSRRRRGQADEVGDCRRCCTRCSAAPCSATSSPPPRRCGAERTLVVVGHERRRGRPRTSPRSRRTPSTVLQAEQRGTGHAVRIALEAGPRRRRHRGGAQRRRAAAAAGDAGRAGRGARGGRRGGDRARRRGGRPDRAGPDRPGRRRRRWTRIVEERDATAEQRAIREINAGIYAFDAARCGPGARQAVHRQRPGRGVPDRRVRAARRRPASRCGVHVAAGRRPRRWAATTGPSWPRCGRCCATGSTRAGCAPASRSSTRRRPGST